MLKKVGLIAATAGAFAVVVAATLGGTASATSASATKTALCKKAGLGFAGPLTGAAAFLGKHHGFIAGLIARIQFMLSALFRFQAGTLRYLLIGQKIDGTQ